MAEVPDQPTEQPSEIQVQEIPLNQEPTPKGKKFLKQGGKNIREA